MAASTSLTKRSSMPRRHSHEGEHAGAPIAMRLPPYSDELLSSGIGRHAACYAVPPLVMLRHCLPEAPSLRAADLDLSSDQEVRLANMFVIEPAAVHRMTFAYVAQPSRRLIATRPTQYCANCSPGGAEPAPVLRSQLLGWRITRPLCGDQLRDYGPKQTPLPFPAVSRCSCSWRKAAR